MNNYNEQNKNMDSCYIIIPENGSPYIIPENTENIFDDYSGYDIGSKNIGIVSSQYRLRVIVYTDMNGIFDNKPSNALIYHSDDIDRKSYGGIDKETSEKILDNLKSREWVLWDKPPKNQKKSFTERKRHSET